MLPPEVGRSVRGSSVFPLDPGGSVTDQNRQSRQNGFGANVSKLFGNRQNRQTRQARHKPSR
eukprot:8645791-Lingulodinium_polyedra.AAC.1